MTSQSNQMSLLSSFLFFFLTMVLQDCRLVFYFCYINRNSHYLVRFVQKKSSHACCRIGLRVDLYEIGSGFHRFPQQTLVQELLICPDWKILLFRFSNETAIPELKSTFCAGWCYQPGQKASPRDSSKRSYSIQSHVYYLGELVRKPCAR